MRAVVIEGREQFAARREFATLGDVVVDQETPTGYNYFNRQGYGGRL